LIGTDEKDYYIEMEYEIIGSEAPETIYEDMEEDNAEGYKDGDTIVSAYKGYTVKTYKVKYDKETGELIAREYDRTSRYKKRDKVVARIEKPTEPPTEAPAPEDPDETGDDDDGDDGDDDVGSNMSDLSRVFLTIVIIIFSLAVLFIVGGYWMSSRRNRARAARRNKRPPNRR
jgi:cbb3-type cytochrome oxidase subunit 3